MNNLIPIPNPDFIKFGRYNDVEKIINSRLFVPVYITGLARSGKTCMVEQICATNSIELIRVNITEETDEDQLLGGFRLKDGNTVWHDGPVVTAMELGAVLLLDEIDLGTSRCMCLQPVLEGSSIFVKRIGKMIKPKEGFTIVATANTKGQGDTSGGKFKGAQILNEAFLDRFSITIEHEYPPKAKELSILQSHISKTCKADLKEIFLDSLVTWAGDIRSRYSENTLSDVVSTGRLIHIVKIFNIFGNPFGAVKDGISRFDPNIKEAFYELFTKKFAYDEDDFYKPGTSSRAEFIKRLSCNVDTKIFNTRFNS